MARDRAKAQLNDLDETGLASIAAEARKIAGSLDEEGARMTVSLHDERERQAQLASELEREARRLARQAQRMVSPRRRGQVRGEAVERAARAEEARRLAARAHDQIRDLGESGRHLYPWFERHEEVLARGLAAELALDAARGAVYHVLGGAGHSVAHRRLPDCRSRDRHRPARAPGQGARDPRQLLLFQVAAELYGREEGVSLNELLGDLDGKDLDRVLQAIAMVRRRQLTMPALPEDLWIRAAEPEEE